MKITKKKLKQIIKEELSHSSIGAGREPKEIFTSASESLMQAHKDLQMLSLLLKNEGIDVQPTEDLIKSVERTLTSLDDLVKQDVGDLQAASEILNTRAGSYKDTTLPGGKRVK
jgi:hypothetical protein